MAAEVPKKKPKKVKQSLRDFLGTDTKSNWAEETEDNFIPREPEKERDRENARTASQWRSVEAVRNGSEAKPIPDSPPFTCYIGNLPYSVTKEEIAAFFPQAVKDVRLINDKTTGGFKGFGYVEFATRDDLIQAVQSQNNKPLGDRQVRLDFAGASRNDRDSKPGFSKGNTIRSENGADFGRDSMGTGVVVEQERRRGRGNGSGSASGFGGADFNRDQMGNVVESQRQFGRGTFSRESMCKEVVRSEPREQESTVRRQREQRAPPEFSRDAMNSEKQEECATIGIERVHRASPRTERPDPPPFSRDHMASEQAEQLEWRTEAKKELREEGATNDGHSPVRRPTREVPFSREAMQTEQPEQYVPPEEKAPRPRRGDWREHESEPKPITTSESWRASRGEETEQRGTQGTRHGRGRVSTWMQEEAHQTKQQEAAKVPADKLKKQEPKKAERKVANPNRFDVLMKLSDDNKPRKPKRVGKSDEDA